MRLRDSKLGRVVDGDPEDETAAAAMASTRSRQATGVSLARASRIRRRIHRGLQTAIFAETFNFNVSILVVVIIILGGIGPCAAW